MEKRGMSFKGSTPWDLENDYPADGSAYEIDDSYPAKEGATAKVYKGYCSVKNSTVAIKMVDLDKYEGKTDLDQLSQEASVMRKYRHYNILPLFCSFVHGHHLWLVMPWISGGTLAEIVQARFPDGMEEDLIATIAKDVLQGLEYMHDDGSMHRDLKSGNLLVADSGHILLADFGACAILEREAAAPGLATALHPNEDCSTHSSGSFSSVPGAFADGATPVHSPSPGGGSIMLADVPEDSASSWSAAGTPMGGRSVSSSTSASNWGRYLSRNTFIGTPHYIAPEVMHVEVEGYTQSADIWAFGIIMLELATGAVPRKGMGFVSLVMQTVHGDVPSLADAATKRTYSKAMHDFTARCLDKNPSARMTPGELLKHPFLERARDNVYLAHRLLGAAPQQQLRSTRRSSDSLAPDSEGSSPSTTAHLPPKADKSWLGRMRSTKNLKPSAPQGVIPIWQIKWVVYVTGRRYCICYQLDQAFREARILINDVEIMRKTYKALERMFWHTDNYNLTLEEPQLQALQGKKLIINVRAGSGCLDGFARLDGTVIESPACVSTRADMSPCLPPMKPLSPMPSYKKLPSQDPLPSPFLGVQESSSEADLAPMQNTDKETEPRSQPQLLPRSTSTPGHTVEDASDQPAALTEEQLRHVLHSIKV